MGDGRVGSIDLSEGRWSGFRASSTSVVTSTATASVEDGLRWDAVDDLHLEEVEV